MNLKKKLFQWKIELKYFFDTFNAHRKAAWARYKYQVRVFHLVQNYVSKYGQRTEQEHAAIRASIQIDPKRCSHLKGQKFGRFVGLKDYAILSHRLPTGAWKHWCMYCKQHWQHDDPELLKMLRETTNAPSASEHFLSKEETSAMRVVFIESEKDSK